MAITVNPITGKITFGVVADGTNDSVALDLASQFGVSEDFKDDFSGVDNWVETGTLNQVNVGTDVLDFDFDRDSTNHKTVRDLITVDDNSWVLRWKMTHENITANFGGSTLGYVGMIDTDETVPANGTNDFIGLEFILSDTANIFRLIDANGSAISSGIVRYTFNNLIALNTLYFEVKRLSTTTMICNVYSDANYSVLIESSGSVTCSASVIDLRFITVATDNQATSVSVENGTIDDVQFWNAKTVPIISSTNWRLRYKLDYTVVNDSGSAVNVGLFIGLGDKDAISGSATMQDGFYLLTSADNGVDTKFRVQTPDNTAPDVTADDSVFALIPSVDTFFVEMIRDSASQTTVSIYSDATFTTLVETQVQAGVSGSDNLKYLKLFNAENQVSPNTLDGTFDDFTFTDLSVASPTIDKIFTVNALLQVVNGLCGLDLTDLNVYYTFDEASGNLINNATAIGSVDAIANTDGTVGASVTRSITGQVSDGYESNGDVPSQSANRIGLLSSNVSDFDFMINDGEVYTVNLWINTTVTPAVQGFGEMLVNQNNTGGSRGFLFQLLGDDGFGKNSWRIRPREGGEIFSLTTNPNASNGGSFSSFEWHMLTVVVDIDALTADYYLDGQFKVQSGSGGASPPFAGSGDTQMQLNSITITQAGRSLLGKTDEYSIWRRGLSSNEIGQLYALNSGGIALRAGGLGAICFTVNALLKQLGVNGCGTSFFTTDFSSATGWASVANDIGGVAVTGGQLTGWGSDGGFTREIFYDLVVNNGVTISDTNWVAEFDFRYTVPSTSTNPGHSPFTLSDSTATTDSFQTSGPATPSVPHPRSISMVVGNQNAFNIDRGVQILIKDTTTSISSVGVSGLAGVIDLDAFANITVFPRLERTSATTYKLSVFTDSARTIHVTGTASGGDSPVTLTSTQVVTSTNFIHSSNNSAGGGGRVLTGFLDNLTITAGVGACPEILVDACLQKTIDKTFTVNAILEPIQRTCSPWLNFANGDGSTQRLLRNGGGGQCIEFPLVNVDTFVTGFKIRLQRTGAGTGGFNARIFLYPPSQGSGGAISVVGTSVGLSGASIPTVLTETTAVFDPPVKLVPNQRYMIGFFEGFDSGVGVLYETRITTGTQFQYAFQIPNSGTPPNWINLLTTDRQIAGDILVLNGDASLCFTVNAILEKVTAWQFREQRTTNDQGPSGGAPIITFSNEPTRFKIDSTTPSIGFGWLFKTFLLSEITGSTIKADWAGTGTAQIRVYDGRYERTNFGDFIPNESPNSPDPISTVILKGAGLLGDIETISPSSTTTLDGASINYAGALLDEVTVFIKLADVLNSVSANLNIASITVTGNGSVYNFENPTLVQEETGTEFDWGFVDATSITDPSVDFEFTLDACLGIFTARRSDIGSLIVKVLQLNPGGLTGLQIVKEINIFTEANNMPFVGKTSRIKNWIGFLDSRGIIQDDGSNPSWYVTIWTLVP